MTIEEYLKSKFGPDRDISVIPGGKTPIYPVENIIRLDGDRDDESTGVHQKVQ